MSLINQMLRDLQEQKGRKQHPQKGAPAKKMERIPYLPLPLVVGVAAVVLVLLIWWFAGVLSELMFGFDAAPEKQQQQVVKEQTTPSPATFVHDQLTAEERNAEPPVTKPERAEVETTTEAVVDKKPAPATRPHQQLAKKVVNKKAVSPKPVKSTPVVNKKRKQAAPAATPVRQVQEIEPVIVKVPEKLHPDDLPGAIRSASPVEVEPAQIMNRPDRRVATTPYGRAEESYLDGVWALEKERKVLAERSLRSALSIYPGHLKARELLAEIQEKEGKIGETILLLKEGLEIAPDYIDFKKRYARLMVKQGDYDAATKVLLQSGLPDVAVDPETHTILASLYQKLGEHFLAAQTYRNLLVVWPQTGAFWVGLGSALEGQGLPQEAVDCYQRALETENLRKDLTQYARKRLRVL